jgi:ATP-dependent RNA helicase DDX35
VIVVDDCHERSLKTDLSLGLLKKILKKRSDLKVVISSATNNIELLKRFFSGIPA